MSDVAAEAADAPLAAGFKVTAASGLKTTERGGQATFTVALLAPPTAVVSVALISDRTGEGTVSPKSASSSRPTTGTRRAPSPSPA